MPLFSVYTGGLSLNVASLRVAIDKFDVHVSDVNEPTATQTSISNRDIMARLEALMFAISDHSNAIEEVVTAHTNTVDSELMAMDMGEEVLRAYILTASQAPQPSDLRPAVMERLIESATVLTQIGGISYKLVQLLSEANKLRAAHFDHQRELSQVLEQLKNHAMRLLLLFLPVMSSGDYAVERGRRSDTDQQQSNETSIKSEDTDSNATPRPF